jgi:hypothetical protein
LVKPQLQINCRQIIPHLIRILTYFASIALSKLTLITSTPALYIGIVQQGAGMAASCGNGSGSASGSKVNGRQIIAHLIRSVS